MEKNNQEGSRNKKPFKATDKQIQGIIYFGVILVVLFILFRTFGFMAI